MKQCTSVVKYSSPADSRNLTQASEVSACTLGSFRLASCEKNSKSCIRDLFAYTSLMPMRTFQWCSKDRDVHKDGLAMVWLDKSRIGDVPPALENFFKLFAA